MNKILVALCLITSHQFLVAAEPSAFPAWIEEEGDWAKELYASELNKINENTRKRGHSVALTGIPVGRYLAQYFNDHYPGDFTTKRIYLKRLIPIQALAHILSAFSPEVAVALGQPNVPQKAAELRAFLNGTLLYLRDLNDADLRSNATIYNNVRAEFHRNILDQTSPYKYWDRQTPEELITILHDLLKKDFFATAKERFAEFQAVIDMVALGRDPTMRAQLQEGLNELLAQERANRITNAVRRGDAQHVQELLLMHTPIQPTDLPLARSLLAAKEKEVAQEIENAQTIVELLKK